MSIMSISLFVDLYILLFRRQLLTHMRMDSVYAETLIIISRK